MKHRLKTITEKTISVEEKATNMEDMLKEEEKGAKVRLALRIPRTTAVSKRVKWLDPWGQRAAESYRAPTLRGRTLYPVAIFFILAHFFPVPTVPCSPTYACQCADLDNCPCLTAYSAMLSSCMYLWLTLPSPYIGPLPVFDRCFKLFQSGSVFGKWFVKCTISFIRLTSSSARLWRASKSKINF